MNLISQSTLPEGGLLAFGCKFINHVFAEFEAFGVRTKLNDFSNLLARIPIRLHDQTTGNDKMEAM
jgi:hypothetical protein